MWYPYYNGTSAEIPFNTRASETIKETKHIDCEGKKTSLNKEEGHWCSELVTMVVFLRNLILFLNPNTLQQRHKHFIIHSKAMNALWKLSIPSQFQGDLRISWDHCTLKILGISHLILSTKILYRELMLRISWLHLQLDLTNFLEMY